MCLTELSAKRRERKKAIICKAWNCHISMQNNIQEEIASSAYNFEDVFYMQHLYIP